MIAYIALVLIIFGVLGGVMASLLTSSMTSSATPNYSRRALYMTEAGMRYGLSELRNTEDWKGKIGFVPTVLEESAVSPDNTVALLCGPPIMIKFSLQSLKKMGFSDDQVISTLENRMKCGLGKCGRCNVGNIYVCKDGPVFKATEIAAMPNDY